MRRKLGHYFFFGFTLLFCTKVIAGDSLRPGSCICRKADKPTPRCELIRVGVNGLETPVFSVDLQPLEAAWGACNREACVKDPSFHKSIEYQCGGSFNVLRQPSEKRGTFLDTVLPGKCWCEATKNLSFCYLMKKDEEGNVGVVEQEGSPEPGQCNYQYCLRYPRWGLSLAGQCQKGLVPGRGEKDVPAHLFDAMAIPSGACFCEEDRDSKSCVLYKKLGQLLVPLDSRPLDLEEMGHCHLEKCLNSKSFLPIISAACPNQVDSEGRVPVTHLAWSRRKRSKKSRTVRGGVSTSQTGSGPFFEDPTLSESERRRRLLLRYIAVTKIKTVSPLKYYDAALGEPVPPPLYPKRMSLQKDESRLPKLKTALKEFSKFNFNVFRGYFGSQAKTDLAVNNFNAKNAWFTFPALTFTHGAWNRPKTFHSVAELLYTLSDFLLEHYFYANGKKPESNMKLAFSRFDVAQGAQGYEYLTGVGKERTTLARTVLIHFDPRLVQPGRKVPLSFEDFHVYVQQDDLFLWKMMDGDLNVVDPEDQQVGRFLKWDRRGYWLLGLKMSGNSDVVFSPVSPGFVDPYEKRGSYGRLSTVFQGTEPNLKSLVEARRRLDEAYQASLFYTAKKIEESSGNKKTEWVITQQAIRTLWEKSVAPPENGEL